MTDPTDFTQIVNNLERELTNMRRDLRHLPAGEQYDLLRRRAVHTVKSDLLQKRLATACAEGKPLVVKYGIDPTGHELHLGHIASIIVARRLLQMGHRIIILFGEFTAFVGDPTGRVETRPVLTTEQIRANVASYQLQVSKFIPIEQVEIVSNAPFYQNMTIQDLFRLYRSNRLAPLLQREDFRKRAEGLTIAEALYPTLMAIDSLHLKPDLELGGNDQLLNFQVTAAFMESENLVPQSAITTALLQGTSGDGNKMSKSLGNYIGLQESPDQIYGKVMSIPDALMESYFKLLTDLSDEEWTFLSDAMSNGALNPIIVKKLLARILVTFMHSQAQAREAEESFERIFSRKVLPDDMPQVTIGPEETKTIKTVVDLLRHCGAVSSNSEARRSIQGGAVRWIIGEEVISVQDPTAALPSVQEWVLKVGKRLFFRITRT